MKRALMALSLAIILAVCMSLVASAESTLPDKQVLADAKQAVMMIHYKEYQTAAKLLGISDIREIARQCEENCPEMFRAIPQSEISVAYNNFSGIYIAVPISVPSSSDCKAIVFTLSERFEFLSVRILPWQKVTEEYSMADSVIWNVEYIPGYGSILD